MTATDETPIIFNPLEPGYIENPYPHLAELRELDPVHYTLVDNWALFRYDDTFALLRNPELSVDDAKANFEDNARFEMFTEIMGDDFEPDTSILNIDPPDHTRLRRLVSKAFTPATIEELRPSIQAQVDAALDRVEAAGQADIVAELAFPLPFDVISDMLGMPEADKEQIRDWSEALVKTLDPIVSEDDVRAAFEASKAMNAHIDSVVKWKQANPADDLLTRMIAAEEDGDRMSAIELRDQVALLFVAGHETTVNLIGTGIYELMRNPDQLAKLRDDASLDAGAVDELLRYVSPVQFSRRITTSEIEMRGKTIPNGMFVLACLAAANRDPEKWGPTADALDITREHANQHLAFGSGSHFCLGSSLAKLEAQIAIGTFVRRFPSATLTDDVQWHPRINLRGLQKLVIDVSG